MVSKFIFCPIRLSGSTGIIDLHLVIMSHSQIELNPLRVLPTSTQTDRGSNWFSTGMHFM